VFLSILGGHGRMAPFSVSYIRRVNPFVEYSIGLNLGA
jgi:hypothetical protein